MYRVGAINLLSRGVVSPADLFRICRGACKRVDARRSRVRAIHCRAFQFLRTFAALSLRFQLARQPFAYSTRVHDPTLFHALASLRASRFLRGRHRVNSDDLPMRAMFTVTGRNDATSSDPPRQIRSAPSLADSKCRICINGPRRKRFTTLFHRFLSF